VRVFLSAAVVGKIVDHASSDTSREVGGVLVGRLLSDADGPYVLVSSSIEARRTEAGGAHVKFTIATWADIEDDLEKKHPGEVVVGWYHSHPGFGVFMSEFDKTVHRHFSARWQTALVVDPLRQTLDLFGGESGKVERLAGYYIYGERAGAAAVDSMVHTWLRSGGPVEVVKIGTDEKQDEAKTVQMLVEVPNLLGLSVEQAALLLQQRRLHLSVLPEEGPSDIPRGCVSRQTPGMGEMVKTDSTLRLALSAGAKRGSRTTLALGMVIALLLAVIAIQAMLSVGAGRKSTQSLGPDATRRSAGDGPGSGLTSGDSELPQDHSLKATGAEQEPDSPPKPASSKGGGTKLKKSKNGVESTEQKPLKGQTATVTGQSSASGSDTTQKGPAPENTPATPDSRSDTTKTPSGDPGAKHGGN
jgi:proteasome lid subunit RPN8/RPN11